MHHPTIWLEACRKALDVEVALNAQSNHPNFVARAHPSPPIGPTQTLKVQKVLPIEMAERRKQGLCY